jgi:hypothetical protein
MRCAHLTKVMEGGHRAPTVFFDTAFGPRSRRNTGMSIRWDAVVDRSIADVDTTPRAQSGLAGVRDQGPISVRVRLFGALCSLAAERTIQLEVGARATLADVFARLADRLGESFLAHVLEKSGAKRRHCRVFVGGYPVEDLRTALCAVANPGEIDIILLIAPEGG